MNKKGFVNIILIIAVVVLVGVGGYFAFVKKSEPVAQQTPTTQTSQPTKTQTPNNQPAPTTQNLTAEWKTYKNEKYGIELKYPSGWQVVEGGGLLNLEKRFLPTTNTNPEVMNGFCKLGFHALDKRSGETIKDWLYRDAAENGNPTPTDLTTVTFGARTGLREVGGEIGIVNSIFLPLSDTGILSTSLLCGEDVRKDGDLEFDQILSTLKFNK